MHTNKIGYYETKHSKYLIDIYDLYSLLEDYYKNLSLKHKDEHIGKFLSSKFKGIIFVKYKVIIKEALTNIRKLYRLKVFEKTKDEKFNRIILTIIKEHIEYFERMLFTDWESLREDERELAERLELNKEYL